jgi:hypothetical protein
MLAHAIGAGCVGLIDMDSGRRLVRASAADVGCAVNSPAHRVIKDDDAVRA